MTPKRDRKKKLGQSNINSQIPNHVEIESIEPLPWLMTERVVDGGVQHAEGSEQYSGNMKHAYNTTTQHITFHKSSGNKITPVRA